jgi:hypothetical protein
MGGVSAHLNSSQVSRHTPGAIAARQHDLVTVWQLRAAGLTDGAITHRVAAGTLRRVHRGVYTVSRAPLTREAEWLAAVLACGEGAALSHLAAATLHGINGRFRAPAITVVAPRLRRLDGVKVHRCRRLDPRDITTHKGIPVTTVHRVFVDASDMLTPHQVANLIHEAAYRGRWVEPAVRDVIARMNGRHNLDVLERAIALHRAGSAGTRSGAEDAFLRLGLPEPRVNMDVAGFEVDFHWPERRVAVEIDGPGHGRSPAAARDGRLEAALARVGYVLLRFTDADVHERPDAVARALRYAAAP